MCYGTADRRPPCYYLSNESAPVSLTLVSCWSRRTTANMPLFRRKRQQDKRAKDDIDWNERRKVEDQTNSIARATSEHSSPMSRRPISPPRLESILQNPIPGQTAHPKNPQLVTIAQVQVSKFPLQPNSACVKAFPASKSLTFTLPEPRSSPHERGRGPWESARPRSLRRNSSRTSNLSRSLSRCASRSHELHRSKSELDAIAPRFPFPPIQQAIQDLHRTLRDRTKNFRLKDYLEPEEIANGRIWEEEEETLLDCVRDRSDDELEEDRIWRLDRKRRTTEKKAKREAIRDDGSECRLLCWRRCD